MSDKLMEPAEIKDMVRALYGGIAADCGAPAASSCCDVADVSSVQGKARGMGYSAEELAAVPDGANLGLGCGNPQAIAAMQPGEVVIDLGSGAGFDCLPAAREVGATGRVIGVAALATVFGVVVEVPVMLSVVHIIRHSRTWYERGAGSA